MGLFNRGFSKEQKKVIRRAVRETTLTYLDRARMADAARSRMEQRITMNYPFSDENIGKMMFWSPVANMAAFRPVSDMFNGGLTLNDNPEDTLLLNALMLKFNLTMTMITAFGYDRGWGESIIVFDKRGATPVDKFNYAHKPEEKIYRIGGKDIPEGDVLKISTAGYSLYQPIWEVLIALQEGTRSASKFYIHGVGWIDISDLTPGTDEQTDALSSAIGDLLPMGRLIHDNNLEAKYVGPTHSPNPKPFDEMLLNKVSMHTKIPMLYLMGAAAGALASSESNERQYWVTVEVLQRTYHGYVQDIITKLDTMGIIPENSIVGWEDAFKQSPRQLAEIKMMDSQSMESQVRAGIISVEEARVELGYDPGAPVPITADDIKQMEAEGMSINQIKRKAKMGHAKVMRLLKE